MSKIEEKSEHRTKKEKNHEIYYKKDSHSPSSTRVTILKPFSNQSNRVNSILVNKRSSSNSPSANSIPLQPQMQILSSHVRVSHSSQSTNVQSSQNVEQELINDAIDMTPFVMKIIDPNSWSFLESPFTDVLFSENSSLGPGGFTVISAIGTQSVGKSSLLNKIAGTDVFKTHESVDNPESFLKHLTRGIDLHITKERLLLLDPQPLVSASILDEYIKNGQNNAAICSDISEPETYVYISSLQILSFLVAVCDYVIIVNDWTIDFDLIKLLSTAIMIVGNDSPKADIIFQFSHLDENDKKEKLTSILQSLLGSEFSCIKGFIDENETIFSLLQMFSKKNNNNRGSAYYEKSWLVSAQRFWENSIRKSTLYSDYARLMP